jgi:hypothetical protein
LTKTIANSQFAIRNVIHATIPLDNWQLVGSDPILILKIGGLPSVVGSEQVPMVIANCELIIANWIDILRTFAIE